MKDYLREFDYDHLFSCLIAAALVFVSIGGDPVDKWYYLFAATFVLIHAHGNRIYRAIREDKRPVG